MGALADGLRTHLSDQSIATLSRAKVGIAGSGGLGSHVAMLLVRSGIGSLVLVDGDTVAESNLNRQLFFPQDIGKPKVRAMEAQLLHVEPDLHFTGHQCWLDEKNTAEIFSGCDIVVEAVDKAATKAMLVNTLLEAGFFVVSASGLCGWGFTPMSQQVLPGRLVVVGDFSQGLEKGLPPMGPRVMQAAAMQADAVLYHLLGPCPLVE